MKAEAAYWSSKFRVEETKNTINNMTNKNNNLWFDVRRQVFLKKLQIYFVKKSKMDESEQELLRRAREERQQIVAKYEAGEDQVDVDDWENPDDEIYHRTDRYGFV